jgi:hypothetical protein
VVQAHPDRLRGNAYLDPRGASARDTLHRFLDLGFRAVKLFPPAGVPVLAHTGQTNIRALPKRPGERAATDSRFGHPMNFDRIARLFPGVTWVLAHMGYPHYVEAWSVAHANPNVFLDISGSGPWTDGIPLVYNALGGQQFIPIDFARVLWGSDNCLPPSRAHGAHGRVPAADRRGVDGPDARVRGENARKLLKLA